jgi:hypothetical protein
MSACGLLAPQLISLILAYLEQNNIYSRQYILKQLITFYIVPLDPMPLYIIMQDGLIDICMLHNSHCHNGNSAMQRCCKKDLQKIIRQF